MSKDIDDEENAGGISKWIPTIVLFGAIIGFVSLAWYSYHVGKESVKEEDLLVVEADSAPVKEKPLDAGGMKFPNQDKTVFETFSSNQQPAKVERVLPAPEEPITNNEEMDSVIDQNTQKPVVRFMDKPVAEKPTAEKPIEKPAVEVKKIEVAGIDNKKPDEIKVTDKISIKKDEPVKAQEKSLVKTNGQKIQLGAYGSDKEARDVWIKLQKKIPALSNKSPIIVRADIQGKGIFYRLRVAGFGGKDDAKSFCKTLSTSGQACILVSE